MSASISSPHFLLRRLHSLTGLVPLGGFLLFHLWENSQSRFGAAHYQEVVDTIQSMNYLLVMELGVLALPIAFHALYGLVVWWDGKSNVSDYGYLRNWLWWIQRISGIGLVLFLAIHVGTTRIWGIIEPSVAQNVYGHMRGMLSDPAWLAFYLGGLVLATFHLCNGLRTMCISWGVTTTDCSQRRAQWAFALLFLVVTALGVHGALGFLYPAA